MFMFIECFFCLFSWCCLGCFLIFDPTKIGLQCFLRIQVEVKTLNTIEGFFFQYIRTRSFLCFSIKNLGLIHFVSQKGKGLRR